MIPFYLDVDGATHQANFDANTAAFMRMVALTVRDQNGTPLYSAAWVPSDGRAWVACHGYNHDDFISWYNSGVAQGYEMKIVTSTDTVFAGVMEGTKTGTTFVYDIHDGNASSAGSSAPAWATSLGATTTDGSSGLTWTLVSIGAPPAWSGSKSYAKGALITDSNGCLQQATNAGTSGSSAPAWANAAGQITTDGSGAAAVRWMLIAYTAPPMWTASQTYAQGNLISDSNHNLQQASTTLTLNNVLNANRQPYSNFVPRSLAIYAGNPGYPQRYAIVFDPCAENWSYRYWDSDAVATQAVSAFFNDLLYRPTLMTYKADGTLFSAYRDDSIGVNNWTASNALSSASMIGTWTSFSARGLWPISLSVNPSNDTFACVMVTTETPLPRTWNVSGSDLAKLTPLIDPLIQTLMTKPSNWLGAQPRVVSLALVYKQRLVFAKAYTNADATYPVATPISMFRMASCSKPITSVAIGCLIQDGLLTEASPVTLANLTPPPGMSFPAGFSAINVNQLRSHRSGLQPGYGNIAAAYGHANPYSIYEQNAYWVANGTIQPGFSSTNTMFQYQNSDYSLLGLIMRAVANGLYTSYVQEKIFSPLGLTRPRVGPSLHSQRGDLEVQQHSSYPSSLKQNIFTAAPALVGSGYGDDVDENYEAFMDWSISAVDYAAILAAVEAANTGKHPILNRAGVTTLYQQIVPGLTEGGSFTMGGLIFVISPANHTVYGHDGGYSTGGMNIATWVFSRDDGISGAIFMNMDDPNVPDPLGQFAFWNPSNLQAVLDQVTTWPAHGDLFPSYGIPSL